MDIKSATMRKYISRGLLVESSQGEINVYNTKNQNWIVDYCDKKEIDFKPIFEKSEKRQIPKQKPSVQKLIVDSELKRKEIRSISEETTERSLLNTKELQKKVELKTIETQLKSLELEKKKAKVMPTDFVIQMLNTYIKTNITGIKTDGSKIIDLIVDELEGDYETKLKFKKKFDKMVNETFKNNHDNIAKIVIEKAKDYSTDRW